jgi:nucleotide-binding universal stress UspA family protein
MLRSVRIRGGCAPGRSAAGGVRSCRCAGKRGCVRELQEDVEQAITQHEKEHPEVTVLRQVAHGGARSALLAAAHDAQLLVVGSRGRGGIKGMLLGSVSQTVLHHSPCRVAVVHPR